MHIIPFKGKEDSGTYNLNLLFNDGKIYIMDNHLAAIWCWHQKIDSAQQYNYLHIDRHYDLLNSQTDWWLESLVNQSVSLEDITVEQFLALRYHNQEMPTNDTFPIFRWDNYLTIFHGLYPDLISTNIFATHKDGDTIEDFELDEKDSWELQNNLAYWLTRNNGLKWIVNLDIDYFFTDYDEKYYQLFTDEFILRIADEIKQSMNNIEVFTIALSPEMCGGWDNAIRVAKLITGHINANWIE